MNLPRGRFKEAEVRRRSRNASGFTLVELMIAMLLGLIVVAGVISVFLAGQKSYRTNQALGDVQDSSRVAFEMMAHDIRKAGLTGCDSGAPVANLLNNGPVGSGGAPDWWVDFDNAIRGYGQGTVANPEPAAAAATGTDSLVVLSAADSGYSVDTTGAKDGGDKEGGKNFFEVYESHPNFEEGGIVMMCDPGQAALFQISNVHGNGKTFSIAATSSYKKPGEGEDDEDGTKGKGGSGDSAGNCTTGMAYPTTCGAGHQYPFQDTAQVAALDAADWYVGDNTAGGQSLYRIGLQNVGGTPTPIRTEMVRNVTGMILLYHQAQDPAFVAASAVTDWPGVNAVRVTLTVESGDQHASISGNALQKTFAATLTLRNRVR